MVASPRREKGEKLSTVYPFFPFSFFVLFAFPRTSELRKQVSATSSKPGGRYSIPQKDFRAVAKTPHERPSKSLKARADYQRRLRRMEAFGPAIAGARPPRTTAALRRDRCACVGNRLSQSRSRKVQLPKSRFVGK